MRLLFRRATFGSRRAKAREGAPGGPAEARHPESRRGSPAAPEDPTLNGGRRVPPGPHLPRPAAHPRSRFHVGPPRNRPAEAGNWRAGTPRRPPPRERADAFKGGWFKRSVQVPPRLVFARCGAAKAIGRITNSALRDSEAGRGGGGRSAPLGGRWGLSRAHGRTPPGAEGSREAIRSRDAVGADPRAEPGAEPGTFRDGESRRAAPVAPCALLSRANTELVRLISLRDHKK